QHRYGMAGFWALIAGFAVTPLREWTGINLICWRRALGLTAFLFITCHLLVWLLLDIQSMSAIGKDIAKRPFITIGMAAFVLMVPLAFTSTNWAMRKMGPVRWRRLHKLMYAVVALGFVHYLMQVRGFRPEAVVYTAIIAVLFLARFNFVRRRAK
ncbi:MAG: protein-methionine-sulfoxide reductase heme-binding subunit MsrQ, partial [Pseudomonadota bacterium]